MLRTLIRHFLAFAFFGWLCWIIYLADTGQGFSALRWVQRHPGTDKLGHFLLVGGLAWLINRALNFRCARIGPLAIPWGALGVLVFAIGEEMSQLFFPSRTFDFTDMLADCCGVAFFTLLQHGWRCRRAAAKS